MEIEAKLSVPDEQTMARLLETPAMAGYSLGGVTRHELHDCYLDTQRRAFLASGYALRLRRDEAQTLVTLKGLGGAEGAVHRRSEQEMVLSAPAMPEQWPAGPLRDKVLELRGDQALEVILEIEQVRSQREVRGGDRQVAELSGDHVRVYTGRKRQPPELSACLGYQQGSREGGSATDAYFELEVELLPGGSEADLAKLADELMGDEWKLRPAQQSKFQRALAGLAAETEPPDEDGDPSPHLTPEERACLSRLAKERAVMARRARLVLAWDEGASLDEMVERSGLSARRARYWRWAFRRSRMGIFRAAALSTGEDDGVPDIPVETPAPPEETSRAAEREAAGPEAAEKAGRPKKRPIDGSELMSEAGRHLVAFHFQRMLMNEPGTREGTDIEALHDMRVATRRMRAAFRVFGEYYARREVESLVKALRRTGRALGEVRDLDVFEQRTHAYMEGVPEAQRSGLDRFLAELEVRRAAARGRLLSHLDSAGFGRFVAQLSQFVEEREVATGPDGDGSQPEPRLVRHVAPVTVMERMAAVRAFEGWVETGDVPLERYHALRIATKRLRYTLEFFSDALGPGCEVLTRKTIALQDHLGLLQDGVVASGILRDFLMWGTWGAGAGGKRPGGRSQPVIAPGVALYLAARQTEMQTLVAGFPAVWSTIVAPEFMRGLAVAVAAI
ncbi:MAG TPA: CHAD domain-containing protein [Anaerolineae bacterium]|nr:CHAD domain-containing protein [Anaerolineae bacterium]